MTADEFAPPLRRVSVEMRVVTVLMALLPGAGDYRARRRKAQLDLRFAAVHDPRWAAVAAVCAWPFWTLPVIPVTIVLARLAEAWPAVGVTRDWSQALVSIPISGLLVSLARLMLPLAKVRVFAWWWDAVIALGALALIAAQRAGL